MSSDPPNTRRLTIVLVILMLLVPIFTVDIGGNQHEALNIGDVSNHDIRADRSFVVVDEQKTKELQRKAVESIPPIFFVDMQLRQGLLERVEQSFQQVRALMETPDVPTEKVHELFISQLGIYINPDQKEQLWELQYKKEVEELCIRLIDEAMYSFIVANKDALPDTANGFQVVRLYANDQVSRLYSDEVLIKSPQEMRQQIVLHAYQYHSDAQVQQASVALASSMISPNFVYQAKETEQKKEEILRSIAPVDLMIRKGEMIIRKGEVIDQERDRLIQKMRETGDATGRWMLFLVFSVLTGLVSSALFFVVSQYIRSFSQKNVHIETLAFLSLCMLLIVRLSLEAGGLEAEGIDTLTFWYLTPFAGGVMLIRVLINVETAFVWMVYTSLLLLFLLQGTGLPSMFFLLSGLIALAALGTQKERIHMLRAGLQVGIFNSAVAILLYMSNLYFSDGYVHDIQLPIMDLILAFLGGVLSGVLALSLIPLFELVGFVTDYRMQELSNRNHRLLQQLRRQSPGTYHHSMNMAALSEAAAEAIGANYLQARIACYYHDIGKSLRPQYFIENQRTGINPHDRLTPEQSARIIKTHVIDGITIGQEHNLPKPIMDAIETHHGTSLIKYFYVRAVEEAGGKENVDETLYRYQGRLPDTRESGIIFLADRVEAACRSLKEPSRKAYREMIQKLVNAAIAEGQLEQCPLTIQEIYTIIRVFTETMVDIQHHRIEYPKLPEEKEETITLEVPNPLHEQDEEVRNESG